MERLTERTADGILVKENYEKESLKTLYSCYGEKPNSYYSNCEEGYCAMEKLADYEDTEEQGRYVKLPCKVGDTVYLIKNSEKIVERKADMMFIGVLWEEFGKEWFPTINEAEAKLKELRGGEDDE